MSNRIDYIEKASELTSVLTKLGINLKAAYKKDSDGLMNGIVFIDPSSSGTNVRDADLLNISEVRARLDRAADAFGRNGEQGKASWVKGLEGFIFAQRTDYALITNYDATIISEQTIGHLPFRQLLANAPAVDRLTPVNWDLSSQKMPSVVKALNNIALMEGVRDVHFQLDKAGRVTYYSDTLSKNELSRKVTGLVERIVGYDAKLVGPLGLNADGKQVATKIDAFKNDRYYLAFDKDTGFEPKYLVDLVENAQIASAASHYLNLKGTAVTNEEGYLVQGKTSVTRTEDGRDTYTYENRNLTSKRAGHIGEYNQMGEIPNLRVQDNRFTNRVGHQSEADLAALLNQYRAVLPADISLPDAPEPMIVSKPKHKARQPHKEATKGTSEHIRITVTPGDINEMLNEAPKHGLPPAPKKEQERLLQ